MREHKIEILLKFTIFFRNVNFINERVGSVKLIIGCVLRENIVHNSWLITVWYSPISLARHLKDNSLYWQISHLEYDWFQYIFIMWIICTLFIPDEDLNGC